MQGTITDYKTDRGFGFITGKNGSGIFFHISNFKSAGEPQVGAAVEFEIGPGRRPGTTAAKNVRVLSGAAAQSGRQNQGRPRPGVQPGQSRTRVSPYTFISRKDPVKESPARLHDRLNRDCFDIGFEVEWEALTPVAANPCSEGATCYPPNTDDHYQGYDKRWLLMDDRLTISPFTVKSAVANGVAALLGSCYRVETKELAHVEDPDTYQCTGAWRRYRVSMDNSFPGIVKEINHQTGEISIFPVTEFFYDEKDPPGSIRKFERPQPGSQNKYHILSETRKHKEIITRIERTYFKGAREVFYVGEYTFGMNLSFGPGDFNKGHYHRFCQLKEKNIIKGRINTLDLQPEEKQKQKVYMGVFKKFGSTKRFDFRSYSPGKTWHQDLSQVKKGGWVYYQCYPKDSGNARITAIGLNYQFKTAFHLHDDAVPESHHTCTDRNLLCPRCALFGMTDDRGNGTNEGGLRGRFKSSALVGPKIAKGDMDPENINAADITVPLHRWMDEEGRGVAGQFLLPIQGQAKANKRDIEGGYFDQQTGFIRGAKEYLHADLDYQGFQNEIQRINNCLTLKEYHGDHINDGNRTESSVGKLDYTHSQRNYAMACRDGLTFTGTLGVENCSLDEAAALFFLLEHAAGGHGFKIGLAKSMGLGSMTSTIKRIWLRKEAGGKWDLLKPSSDGDPARQIGEKLPGFDKALESLRTVQQALNLTRNRLGRKLSYPPPANYWTKFRNNALK